MNMKTFLAFVLFLSLAAASERAAASCAKEELKVVGTPSSKTIRIYDAGGKRVGEIDKSLAVDQFVTECDESLGLVKVKLTDDREVWMNRSEAKRTSGPARNPSVCVTESSTKDPGHVVAATSGAEPTEVHCKPPAK